MAQRLMDFLKDSPIEPLARRFLPLYNWIVIGANIRLVSTWLRGVYRYGFAHRATIAFAPDSLERYSVARRHAMMNRYRTVQPGEPADIHVFWAYDDGPKTLPPGFEHAVNSRCQDISKSYVDQLHFEVFGYGLTLDPTSFSGIAFAKSDGNATHDGKIITLPIAEPEPGLVYQKLVNDIPTAGIRRDHRIPIVAGTIPYVLTVTRPEHADGTLGGRIRNGTGYYDPGEKLSETEIANVLELCDQIGLDYGELDACRDQDDGRIYVVDINRAVGITTVPSEIDPVEKYWEQLWLVADAFDHAYNPNLTTRQSNVSSTHKKTKLANLVDRIRSNIG